MRVFRFYSIPAILYCVYYNLALSNLISFSSPVQFLFLQLRIPITAVLFQVSFKQTNLLTLNILVHSVEIFLIYFIPLSYEFGCTIINKKKSEKSMKIVDWKCFYTYLLIYKRIQTWRKLLLFSISPTDYNNFATLVISFVYSFLT